MTGALVEFLQFVAHSALLSASMNSTLEYYGDFDVRAVTLQEASSIVYELSYGAGGDISAFEFV